MNTSDVVNNPSPTHSWITSVISGIAIVGLVINGLLVFQSLSGDSIVGCGGDSSCHDVLNSRWSSLLGIPVAILGFLLYLVFLIALYRKNLLVLYICLGLILGAVAWFVLVQTVIIGRFCLWCMAAHGVGVMIFCLTLWREKRQGNGMPAIQIGGSFAAMSSVVIGLMQFFGPLPVTHRVEDVRGEKDSRSVSIHAREEGRKVAFDSGRMIYNVKTLPHMGKSDAKHVLVEYFD
ncbi:MAG: vitamin K epoxide reductase family protein, partial [Akkermansiaceae bacterium]